jgi:hypothetical protein
MATSQRSIRKGRTIWIVDAHRDDGKRFVERADEKLTARLWNWSRRISGHGTM